jgi:hypothetical protein
MSAHWSPFKHTSDERAHADDGRKDDTLLPNDQPLDATASQLPDDVIPYSHPRRAATFARVQDDEEAVSPLPEPSTARLPETHEPQNSSGERLLSTGQARLDRVYDCLIALGLRRRARLHQVAAQAEE